MIISENVTNRIAVAATEAVKKHGMLTRDLMRASAILTEECGEVARAALDYTRASGSTQMNRDHLKLELAQVAAVASMWLEDLEEEERDR